MGGHTTDLRELLAAVRNLLMALKDVPYLPPPVWAALDDVRLAVAPDIGPPPDNGPIGRRNHHMTRLEKILRHEILITFGIGEIDRKSTRLNSSHQIISYAVFCLKKKNKKESATMHSDRTYQ